MNDLSVQERTLGQDRQYSSPHGNAGGISMHELQATQEEEIEFGALYGVPSADQQEAMMYSMRCERFSSTNEIGQNEIRSETRQPCARVEDSIPTSSSPNKYTIRKGASVEISSSSTTTTGYIGEKEIPLNQESINKGGDADYPRSTNIDGDGNLFKQNTNSSETNLHSGALNGGIAGHTKGEGNGAESRNDKDESERGNPPRLRPIKPIGALGRSNTVSGHTLHIMTRMFRPKPNSSSSNSTVTTEGVNVNVSVKRGVNSSVRSRESLMTSSSSTSVSASTGSQKGAGLSNNNIIINNNSSKNNNNINNNIGIRGGEAGGDSSASNGSSSRSPGFSSRSRSHHHQLQEQELEQQRLQRTAPAASEQRERSRSQSLSTAMNSIRRLFASSGPSRSSASTSTSTSTSFSTQQSLASHSNPSRGEMLYSSMNSPACNLTSPGAGSNSNIPGAPQVLNYRLGYSGIAVVASAAPSEQEQQEEQEQQQQDQREEQVPSPPRTKASSRAIGGGRGGSSIRAVGVTDSSPAAAAVAAPTTTSIATASGGEKTGRAQQGRSIFSNNSLYQSISSGWGSAAAGEREGREGRGVIALSVGSRSVDSALSSFGDCDASVDYSAPVSSATATGRKATAEGTEERGGLGLRAEAGGVNASLGASVHSAAASGFSGASGGSASVADHQAVKVSVKVSFRFPLKELAKNDPKLRQRDARAPLPQDLTIKHFRDVKHLADGTNANIYTGILQGEQVIIKIIKKDMVDNRVAIRELDDEFMLLSRLRHPHIVRVYGRGILPRKFIVLEYLAHGTLRFLLSKQSQNRGVGFFKKPIFPFRVFLLHARDMALAFDYLHRTCHPGACVIHRDLKPDNIGFGSDGRLRIFDFGLSTCIHARHYATQAYQMTGQTGSLRYMAPEVALSRKYTETVDVHSYGILVWQMLTETAPFQGLSRASFIEEVARGGRRPPIDPYRKMWPPELCDLLEGCWHPDAFQRPSFKLITMELDELVRKS